MDLPDSNRFRHRKATVSSGDSFLRISPLQNPSSSLGEDLSEDVVVFNNDFSTSSSSSPLPPSPSPPPATSPLSFGILAALPENHPSPDAQTSSSHLFHKSSVSSTSSSSSRSIPLIPKPPLDRIPSHSSAVSSSFKFPQSAPVNVPLMSAAMMKERQRPRDFDADVDDEDEDEDEEGNEHEMIPPHVHIARRLAQTPVYSTSVLEGVGRTLKGRDLRQVRNAVWRHTGFLD